MGFRQTIDNWSDRYLMAPTRVLAVIGGISLAAAVLAVTAGDEIMSLVFHGNVPRQISWDTAQDVATVCLSYVLIALAPPGKAIMKSNFILLGITVLAFVVPIWWPHSWLIQPGGLQTVVIVVGLAWQILLIAKEPVVAPATTGSGGPSTDAVDAVGFARRLAAHELTWILPGLFFTLYIATTWITYVVVLLVRR